MAVAFKAVGSAVTESGTPGSMTIGVPATEPGDLIFIQVFQDSSTDRTGSAAGYDLLGAVSGGGAGFVLGKIQTETQSAHDVTVTFIGGVMGSPTGIAVVYTGALLPDSPAVTHTTTNASPVQWGTIPSTGAWHLTAGHNSVSTEGDYLSSGSITQTGQVIYRGPSISVGLSNVTVAGGGYIAINRSDTGRNPTIALLLPEPPPEGSFDASFTFGPATATGSSPSKAGFSTTFDFGPASVEGQAPESGGAFRTEFSFNPTVEGQTDVSGGFATNFTFIPSFEARGFVTVATLNNQTALVVPRNSGQVLRLNLADTTTVADQPVRVYGSGELQVGPGWWDDILIVNGNYTGPWFDGSHLPAGLDPDTHRVRWVGAQNASTSLYETRTFSGNPAIIQELQSGPWVGGMGHSGVRFEGVPTFIANTGVNGGQAGYAATFREVGSWDF